MMPSFPNPISLKRPSRPNVSRFRYRGNRSGMPMRATTVRFSEDLWELLEAEASQQGISAAQFVRDAAMMRLGTPSGRRGDTSAPLTLEALAAGALRGRPVNPVTPLADPARID